MAEEEFKVLNDQENLVELWRMKRNLKILKECTGNGTSMISLNIPPHEQVHKVAKMLQEEMAAAQRIKSRENRQSVISALTTCLSKLKLFSRVPTNGLCIFCGLVTQDDKKKLINIHFEPFKEISKFVYLCDKQFHVEVGSVN
jgi:peptide chain release factor subunit 1